MSDRVQLLECSVCGGRYPEFLADNPERCRCARAKLRAHTKFAGTIYENATFETLVTPHESVARAEEIGRAIARGERNKGLLMYGATGRGKTHILVATLKECLSEGCVAGLWSAIRLISDIQESYGREDVPDRRVILDNLLSHEVVMLDDLGRERNTPDVEGIMYELLGGLYDRRRTLLITTNVTSEVLQQRYDAALRGRLTEMCEALHIRGRDRRSDSGVWD